MTELVPLLRLRVIVVAFAGGLVGVSDLACWCRRNPTNRGAFDSGNEPLLDVPFHAGHAMLSAQLARLFQMSKSGGVRQVRA